MNDLYESFLSILDEELVIALGCTEPTAFALAAAKCREVLGDFPDEIIVRASGNMIKNVQGVTIPHTKGLKGIRNVTLLGTLVGDSSLGLKVLEAVTDKHLEEVTELKHAGICGYIRKETKAKLYVEVTMRKNDQKASVELMHTHTNITRVVKNGVQITHNPCSENDFNSSLTSRSELSVSRIYDFIKNVDYIRLKEILEKQLIYNNQISQEGLTNDWGISVGKTIKNCSHTSQISDEMRAAAAAGSDARMSGCDLPVVINSGSGNQGMTIGVPIHVYSEIKKIDEETKYRALAMANLIPIHIKTSIGRLSAFCGAVTAAIGVGCAITYLEGGKLKQVENTIRNSVANLTGVICDGAKSSCALKIAASLDAAFIAKELSLHDRVVENGTGIISDDIEVTISNMANIAADGMNETDEMIIDIMSNK
ncbi:L-serine ammonia-lyase, iron-sulfur-dependent, subunit alpha [Mycoplasmatota bacterium WC44]